MGLDRIIHERSRLRIVTFLAAREKPGASFNELQEALDFTSGNLSVQLRKLEEEDYVSIAKTFRENKPYTTVTLTPKGREALEEYLEEMEDIIKSVRE